MMERVSKLHNSSTQCEPEDDVKMLEDAAAKDNRDIMELMKEQDYQINKTIERASGTEEYFNDENNKYFT